MLALLLLSRENRWSSKSHHACMFGRVATEVNTVKIRPTGQRFGDLFQKPIYEETEAADFRFSILIFGEQIKKLTSLPAAMGTAANMTGTWYVSYLIFVFLTSKQKKVRKSLEDNRKIPIFASSEH